MNARITIRMDNAAFYPGAEDDNGRHAAAYVLPGMLRDLADRLEMGEGWPIALRDANGNIVGEFEIYE